jgi:hypothetical protein
MLDAGTELPPGGAGLVRIVPLRSEFWADVRPGHELAVKEGPRVVGYARILEVTECPMYWTPAVARFVRHAWQFCVFVETAPPEPLAARIELARRCLLELYAGALELPRVVPPEGPVPRDHHRDPDRRRGRGCPRSFSRDGHHDADHRRGRG